MTGTPSVDCLPVPKRPAPDTAPKCSIIVPFFNEQANVAPVLSELRRALDAMPSAYEVILVDDGSTDGTASILSGCVAAWPQCGVLVFPTNRGQAAALLAAFRRTKGELLITLDGDGQNDPTDIPLLLARLGEADMVIGVRSRRQDNGMRRTMSTVANAIRRRALGDGVSDSGCALKVFRRAVLESFIPIRTLYSFMPALAAAAGFSVVEVEVNHRPRLAEKSKYGLLAMMWRPMIDMLGVRWFAWRRIEREAE